MIDFSTGRIIDANDTALKFYGYTKTQLSDFEINRLLISSNKHHTNCSFKFEGDFKTKLSDDSTKNVLVCHVITEIFGNKVVVLIIQENQKKLNWPTLFSSN